MSTDHPPGTTSVVLGKNWPHSWDGSTSGEAQVLKDFDSKEEAEHWVLAGCPGVLKPSEKFAFREGWVPCPGSPLEFYLTAEQAAALSADDQRQKFAWFRTEALVLGRPHDRPMMEGLDLYDEEILILPLPGNLKAAWEARQTNRRNIDYTPPTLEPGEAIFLDGAPFAEHEEEVGEDLADKIILDGSRRAFVTVHVPTGDVPMNDSLSDLVDAIQQYRPDRLLGKRETIQRFLRGFPSEGPGELSRGPLLAAS